MICSAKVRYGLRVLIYLGAQESAAKVQLKEIASSEDITIKYLEQIMQQLKVAKFVTVTRGSKGGYQLVASPKSITLKDIYQVLAGEAEVELSTKHSTTGVTSKVWSGMDQTINNYFESVSLSDLIDEYKNNNQSLMYYI